MNYTDRKIAFVSDLQGSLPKEILLICTVGPVALLLRNLLVPWLFPMKSFTKCSKIDIFFKVLLDTLISVVPVLLSVTVASDSTSQVLLLVSLIAFISGLLLVCSLEYWYSDRRSPAISQVLKQRLDFLEGKHTFLTYLRSYVNIATAICILAVDFQVFPRRFAKTELYGYSVMDAGVGMFVAINALVAPEVQNTFRPLRKILERAAYHVGVLISLGFLRLLSVKLSGYHEHITEYGVHWNFFFTLAAIKIISFPFVGLPRIRRFEGICGLLLLGSYHFCLLRKGLKEILINGTDGSNSRDNLFDANREGLISILGYVSLHLIVAGIGRNLFKNIVNLTDKLRSIGELVVLCAFVYTFLYISEIYGGEPSRRMANLPYVLWIVFLLGFHLVLFIVIEWLLVFISLMKFPLFHWGSEILSPFKLLEPCLWSAINYNPLFFFLLANILTGLVNSLIPTMDLSNSMALLILSGYVASLSAMIYLLYLRRTRIG